MPLWIGIIVAAFGALFLIKALYLVITGLAMPVTQGALFVPTHPLRVDAVADALPMKPGQVFVDLGCGDGRVLRTMSRRYGVSARGVDINALACFVGRLRSLGDRNVRIRRGDFWQYDVRDADAVFCYLFPDVLGRLARKLEFQLRPGTPVVSCNFPIPGWSPTTVLRPGSSMHGDPIYVYRIARPAEERIRLESPSSGC